MSDLPWYSERVQRDIRKREGLDATPEELKAERDYERTMDKIAEAEDKELAEHLAFIDSLHGRKSPLAEAARGDNGGSSHNPHRKGTFAWRQWDLDH